MDPERVTALIESACDAMYPPAQNFRGNQYFNSDKKSALHWYQLAVKNNYIHAIYNMGSIFYNEDKYVEAIKWYKLRRCSILVGPYISLWTGGGKRSFHHSTLVSTDWSPWVFESIHFIREYLSF